MVLLVYYLPEIVTKEDTFDDARGFCRDGPCEALFEGGFLTPGENIIKEEAKGGNLKKAKSVCRRAAFCVLARKRGEKQGEEVRDVCRDVHCANAMLDAEKAQFIALEVGSALMQMFREEKTAMDAAIVEGDQLGNLAGGVFHKGPILQLIKGQLSESSITHIHWEVLDAVFRRGNDTSLWSDDARTHTRSAGVDRSMDRGKVER